MELLTLKEVAAELRLSAKTLRKHVNLGKAPPSVLISNRVRFPRRDLYLWLQMRLTAETGAPTTASGGPDPSEVPGPGCAP
jgi:predicted DNA-binding transcriptional regulator AlpA